jgi:hypothetical protein
MVRSPPSWQDGAVSDLLRLAAALAPHAAGKLWDDVVVRRTRRDGVPASVDELTPELVSSLLSSPDRPVRVGRVEMLDRHAGTTSRARIRLHDVEGRGADALPETLFAKLAPIDWPTRLFVNLMELAPNEVRFYSTLGDVVAPHLEVPACHGARMAGPGGRFVLLLEDLLADETVELREAKPLSPSEARPVVEALARMQASLWQSPRFDSDLAWLKAPGRAPNRSAEKAISGLSTKPCLRRFGDMMSDEMQRAVRLVDEERDRLEMIWGRDAHAFSHGDPHAGNFFFRGGRPGFFDWQVCQIAQGTRDLTYFLVNSVDRDLLPDAERDLVGVYRNALLQAGVAAKPFDELLEEVRLHVLYVLIAVVVTAASSTMQSEAIVRSAIENVKAALRRHDSLGAYARARWDS